MKSNGKRYKQPQQAVQYKLQSLCSHANAGAKRGPPLSSTIQSCRRRLQQILTLGNRITTASRLKQQEASKIKAISACAGLVV